MHSLYLTGIHSDLKPVSATSRLRKIVMARLHTEGVDCDIDSSASAAAALDVLRSEGVAFVASSPDDNPDGLRLLTEVKDDLRALGFAAQVDPDIDRLTAEHIPPLTSAPQDATTAPAAPPAAREIPQRGYLTALALMAPSDGNPLQAAALACNLSRTTSEDAVYQGAVDALLLTFPWIRQPLIDQRFINEA